MFQLLNKKLAWQINKTIVHVQFDISRSTQNLYIFALQVYWVVLIDNQALIIIYIH